MIEKKRRGKVERATRETDIRVSIDLDGGGRADVATGVPFLDHMLTLFAVHGFFDLDIRAKGDTEIDDHHTVEDTGICLGQAIKAALGDCRGIRRYGFSSLPMDETLVRTTLDISGRPYLNYAVRLPEARVGSFDTSLGQEFLRAFSLHAGITLHVEMIAGENTHHILEAVFKSLGRALDQATSIDPRLEGVPSSKGSL